MGETIQMYWSVESLPGMDTAIVEMISIRDLDVYSWRLVLFQLGSTRNISKNYEFLLLSL